MLLSLTTKKMGRALRQDVGDPGRRRYRQAVQKAARLLAATHAVPARNLTSVTPSPHNITRKGIELVTAGKPAKPHASHNVSKICRTCAQKSDYQVPRECRAHLKSNEPRENQSSADRLIVAQGSTEKGKRTGREVGRRLSEREAH